MSESQFAGTHGKVHATMPRLGILRTLLLLWLALLVSFASAQTQAPVDTTFRITPQRPVAELEKEALAAQPPQETGNFRTPELVELVKLDPAIKLDIRYATTNNFLSTPMYSQAVRFCRDRQPRRWCGPYSRSRLRVTGC
jgi:D-alanyl-D-alanine dipeptidase